MATADRPTAASDASDASDASRPDDSEEPITETPADDEPKEAPGAALPMGADAAGADVIGTDGESTVARPAMPAWLHGARAGEIARMLMAVVLIALIVVVGIVAGPRLALIGSSLPTGTPLEQMPSASPARQVSTPSPGGTDPSATAPAPARSSAAPSGSTAVALPTQPGRPSDGLGPWAAVLSTKLDIPVVALQAYAYAETVLAATNPQCQLPWTVLAGISKIESNHGRFGNATLGADGVSNPRIIGVPLNGTGGNKTITDTDGGRIDGDTTYDRAVGPMQFIPTTWATYGVDADKDGKVDPFDIDDATLAAARYLCANGRNLSTGPGWSGAVLSYNATQIYRKSVYDAADDYGRRSLS